MTTSVPRVAPDGRDVEVGGGVALVPPATPPLPGFWVPLPEVEPVAEFTPVPELDLFCVA